MTGGQARDISRLASKYLPTELIWEAAFDIYANETEDADDISESSSSMPSPTEKEEKEEALRTIYDTWRLISPSAHGSAALKWGAWLIRHGRGTDASRVIANARTVLAANQDVAVKFDQRWRDIVDGVQNGQHEDGEEDGIDSGDELRS